MTDNRHEKLKISNELLDAMLVGVKTQDDLWGNEGIITQKENSQDQRQTQHIRAADYSQTFH